MISTPPEHSHFLIRAFYHSFIFFFYFLSPSFFLSLALPILRTIKEHYPEKPMPSFGVKFNLILICWASNIFLFICKKQEHKCVCFWQNWPFITKETGKVYMFKYLVKCEWSYTLTDPNRKIDRHGHTKFYPTLHYSYISEKRRNYFTQRLITALCQTEKSLWF